MSLWRSGGRRDGRRRAVLSEPGLRHLRGSSRRVSSRNHDPGVYPGDGDAHGATVAYLHLASSLGAEISYQFRVEGIDRSGEFWTVISRGRTVSGDHLVTLAGGGTGPLGRSPADASRTPPDRNGLTYFDTVDRGAGVILQVRKFSASRRAQALQSVRLRIRLLPSGSGVSTGYAMRGASIRTVA
jgi:hypothetical protein